MRLLIADDSRAIRMLMLSTLKQIGTHDLFMAENGQLAFDRLEVGDIEALFLDLHMPIMDGLGLLKRMRAAPVKINIPVYIVSSDNDLKNINEARQLGAIGYINKPFSPQRLKQKLEEALDVITQHRAGHVIP